MRGPLAGLLLSSALGLALAAFTPPAAAAPAPASEPVTLIDGQPYLPASALGRLLNATRFWRADVRKLVLRAGAHRLVMTVDNPFVILDSRTIWFADPVRSVGGEVQVPLALVDSLPRDTTIARLAYEPRSRRVVRVPSGGVIGSPKLVQNAARARVTFVCERPENARVVGRGRRHFRLRMDGFFAGLLPDSMPAPALIEAIREIPAAVGSGFEFTIGSAAQGWKLVRGADRVTLEIEAHPGPDAETFAPEGPPGPRALQVIVLDPGHGGNDSGVVAGPLVEKDLTLRLAQILRTGIESRLRARVVLTRDTDANPTGDQRAETANRVHADLVLSLHFDAAPGTRARGVTAWCPPATFGARQVPSPVRSAPVEILPWRDVATRHAVPSRDIAESVLGALELRGFGPARLREVLPYPLLGVNAPGIMLECGMLSSPEERARLEAPGGLADLAGAIVEGLQRWLEERS